MCFPIAFECVPWNNRYVYKAVARYHSGISRFRDMWWGLIYDFKYELGKVYELRPTQMYSTYEFRDHGKSACSGFYVCDTVQRAKDERGNENHVILCLEVRKEDFLFHDVLREVATYSRVRVVGEII